MKKIALSVVSFFIFCSISDAQEPLKFARIINTPDQMVGAKILKAGYKRLGIPIEIVEMLGKRALGNFQKIIYASCLPFCPSSTL